MAPNRSSGVSSVASPTPISTTSAPTSPPISDPFSGVRVVDADPSRRRATPSDAAATRAARRATVAPRDWLNTSVMTARAAPTPRHAPGQQRPRENDGDRRPEAEVVGIGEQAGAPALRADLALHLSQGVVPCGQRLEDLPAGPPRQIHDLSQRVGELERNGEDQPGDPGALVGRRRDRSEHEERDRRGCLRHGEQGPLRVPVDHDAEDREHGSQDEVRQDRDDEPGCTRNPRPRRRLMAARRTSRERPGAISARSGKTP